MGIKKNLCIMGLISCIFLFMTACNEKTEVRKYKEKAEKSVKKTEPKKKLQVPLWGMPGNWKEVKSTTSMRLATYETELGSICSIVMIPGKAGTYNANIARWLKQLKKPDDEKSINSILKSSESISTIGKLKGMVLDFTTLIPDKEQAYIITIIDTGSARLFIKLKGESSVLKKEKSDFIIFCQSVKNGN